MSKTQLREAFRLLKEEGQSFKDYCQQEEKRCREQLLSALGHAAKDHNGKPVFYTICRHVSASGMSRTISLHYFDVRDMAMRQLNYAASVITGCPMDKTRDGVVLKGCGMDMGFDLVYRLAYEATGDGYAIEHRWL